MYVFTTSKGVTIVFVISALVPEDTMRCAIVAFFLFSGID